MDSSFSSDWLHKGYFDFSGQDSHHTTTLMIKADLSTGLGLPANGLRIASYPVGPQFRHIYWWREGGADYAEAQFMAAIAKEHPILSLGVAVEKGREDSLVGIGPDRMDRKTWDWPRLVALMTDILDDEVPAVASRSQCAVHLRVSSRGYLPSNDESAWRTHAFSFVEGQWYERHAGRVRVEPNEIHNYVKALDAKPEAWVIVHFARDLTPQEVQGIPPSRAAAMLLEFSPLRRRLRP
jgi:hypothetical protein